MEVSFNDKLKKRIFFCSLDKTENYLSTYHTGESREQAKKEIESICLYGLSSSPNPNSYNYTMLRSAPWWHLNTVGKVGSALNILIGGLLSAAGGGLAAGGIRALIAKVGEAEAKKIVKNVVVNKVKNTLIAWGMSKIASGISNALFQIIMWATDPGTAIAEWLDAHDTKPNNGYIELW